MLCKVVQVSYIVKDCTGFICCATLYRFHVLQNCTGFIYCSKLHRLHILCEIVQVSHAVHFTRLYIFKYTYRYASISVLLFRVFDSLRPSQQFFSHVGTGHGLKQY